jgi:hypothetical protein
MTKPRDPRELDDDMLVRSLLRRTQNDKRAQELSYELRGRLWIRNYEIRNYEIEKFKHASAGLGANVDRLHELVGEVADRLGVPLPRPKPRLQLVKGRDNG